ncbi:BUL1-like protein [Scheffersomyces xylosifermentans]|uniref:BUL1-like protein n=1 Tax=Scheffersomyces xylosifermentans TaxID=1304137 RepID=UPI00315D90DE
MSSNTANSTSPDDELISNILPSYYMFQSTVSKNLTPTDENFRVDPPMYEMSPISTANTGQNSPLFQLQSQGQSLNNSVDAFAVPEETYNIFNEETVHLWENTILANVHKLPNLTKTSNEISSNLDIKIFTTKKVVQKGVPSTIIDISNKEFKQGDYIHGYVTFTNTSEEPIPFDMVYVVFECTLKVLESNSRGLIETEKPITHFKFLNMMDLYASWTYANIDRLATDNGDPHDWCDGETDPTDNTILAIDVKRLFQPGVTYKRYFSFRVPQKLLDDVCECHNLARHTEVPPSIGVPRDTVTPSFLLANKDQQIRDMCFIDTCISYSVDARVIGRSSVYKYDMKSEKDSYIIAKEASLPIRVVPISNPDYYYNRRAIIQENRLYYNAFIDSVRSKLEYGRDLMSCGSSLSSDFLALSPMVTRDTDNKVRHLYDAADISIKHNLKKSRKQFTDDIYQFTTAIKKKSITGNQKILGILSLSTPKEQYIADYVSPVKFRDPTKKPRTEIVIPLELSYFVDNSSSSKKVLPEVKSLSAELTVLTIRSKKYSFPFEFTHEMCFKDEHVESSKKTEPDNFDQIIIKPFQNYVQEVQNLVKNVSNEVLRFETQMYKDIKSIASSKTKFINLPFSEYELHSKSSNSTGLHSSIKTIPWESEKIEYAEHSLYSKKFEMTLDLNNCHLKGPDNKHNKGFDFLTLVPSFQTCLMARIYYIKVIVKLTSGETLIVNVPLTIVN